MEVMRLSRRSALGVGVVAAGGAAAIGVGQRSRGRRWLHNVGLVDGPDLPPPTADVPVQWNTLSSAHMHGEVSWGMSLPDDPQAILLCLHGRGASHRFAFDTMGIHRFVHDAGLPWATVAADGGAASYWHRRTDVDPQAMLFDELLPIVTGRAGRLPLAILGWSMGGYGALLAATRRPGDIRAVAAASPAIWPSFHAAAPGAFDDADDFENHNLDTRLAALRELPVRIDCGEDDPFISNVRAFTQRLGSAEVHFPAGFHDAATWRSFVPGQLEFLRTAV